MFNLVHGAVRRLLVPRVHYWDSMVERRVETPAGY